MSTVKSLTVRKYKEESNKAEENNNWYKNTQEGFKIGLNIMKNGSVTGRQTNRNHPSWTITATTKIKQRLKKEDSLSPPRQHQKYKWLLYKAPSIKREKVSEKTCKEIKAPNFPNLGKKTEYT